MNRRIVVVTPHSAWYSEQSTRGLEEQAMAEVLRVLNGGRARYNIHPEARTKIYTTRKCV